MPIVCFFTILGAADTLATAACFLVCPPRMNIYRVAAGSSNSELGEMPQNAVGRRLTRVVGVA